MDAVRSLAVGLLLCSVAIACSGSEPSGVRGHVVAGPTCPVVQEGSPCPPAPFVGEVRAEDAGTGDEVATVETDEEGNFLLPLEPGDYVLQALDERGGPGGGKPVRVSVEPGSFVTVRLVFDTGIR